MDNPYKYHGVRVQGGKARQFRLFTLRPGRHGDELVGSLENHQVHRMPGTPDLDYEALSWTWGETSDQPRIRPTLTIEEYINGEKKEFGFPLRANLHAALLKLRYEKDKRVLWVDYICIDQGNASERNQQVQLMKTIYKNARQVNIWLGEHEDGSEIAFDFIDEINDLSQWQEIVKDTDAQQKWAALAALMDRPWFSRRWIVQELSLSRRAIIQCAERTLEWGRFETAVSLFIQEAPKLDVLFAIKQQYDFDHEWLGDVRQIAASRLVRLKTDLFRHDSENKIIEYRWTLADLVASLWAFRSQEPHDAIYSVLSLAKDIQSTVADTKDEAEGVIEMTADPDTQSPAVIPPLDGTTHTIKVPSAIVESSGKPLLDKWTDTMYRKVIYQLHAHVEKTASQTFNINYKNDFMGVCKQFLKIAFDTPGHYNLDIILRPWAPEGTLLPSWVRDVSQAAHGPYTVTTQKPRTRSQRDNADLASAGPRVGKTQWRRRNADSLVGEQENSHRGSIYTASHIQHVSGAKCAFLEHELGLQVYGYVLDTISRRQDASQFGNIPGAWLKLDTKPGDRSQLKDQVLENDPLWRTLVADRDSDGRNPPGHYRQTFRYCVEQTMTVDGAVGAINNELLRRRNHPVLKEFLQRIAGTVSNKRLFKSKRDGLLGLAPYEAENGDHICIIEGMSVPVVLRLAEDADVSDGHPRYRIIGDCYLHTMMAGKAQETQKERKKHLTESGKEKEPEFALIDSHRMILL